MKPSHIDALAKTTHNLESLVLDFDLRSRNELEDRLWKIHQELTTVVGALQMDQDEMSGALE
jgi:hypothetical protein